MAVNGGMTLKPIEVDLPMPEDEAELNAKFSELVVSVSCVVIIIIIIIIITVIFFITFYSAITWHVH